MGKKPVCLVEWDGYIKILIQLDNVMLCEECNIYIRIRILGKKLECTKVFIEGKFKEIYDTVWF